MKDSPSKVDQIGVKVRTANDAVQSIKQLRKEIVEIMSQLLCLAKSKNPKGMLPLCNEMITKTRSLLNIWEPSLVEEAFAFIEKHRIIDDTTDMSMQQPKLSPFRNITQQLGAISLELKSPDLEDFATPTSPMGSLPIPEFWSNARRNTSPCVNIPQRENGNNNNNGSNFKGNKSFEIYQDSNETISAINEQFDEIKLDNNATETTENSDSVVFSETHFDVSGEVLSLPIQTIYSSATMPRIDTKSSNLQTNSNKASNEANNEQSIDLRGTILTQNQLNESKNEILHNSNEFNDDINQRNCSIAYGQNGTFLDTKVKCDKIYLNKEMIHVIENVFGCLLFKTCFYHKC